MVKTDFQVQYFLTYLFNFDVSSRNTVFRKSTKHFFRYPKTGAFTRRPGKEE